MFNQSAMFRGSARGTKNQQVFEIGSRIPFDLDRISARGVGLCKSALTLLESKTVSEAEITSTISIEFEDQEPIFAYHFADGSVLYETRIQGFCFGLADKTGNMVAGIPISPPQSN